MTTRSDALVLFGGTGDLAQRKLEVRAPPPPSVGIGACQSRPFGICFVGLDHLGS